MEKEGNNLFLIFLFIIVALVLTLSFIYTLPIERRVIGTRFIIGESPGFDLNTSEIVFGRVPPGGSSHKKISISNEYNFTIIVRAVPSSQIASFVTVESPVIIKSGDSAVVNANLKVPQEASFGSYSGQVVFEIRRK